MVKKCKKGFKKSKEKFPDTVKVANEFGEVEDLKTW